MAGKKILMLTGEFTEEYEIFVFQQGMEAVGHTVHVVCPDKKAGDKIQTSLHDFEGHQTYTEKYGPYTDINGTELDIDGDGEIDFDWFGRPAITGFVTENVPEVTLQGFELEYDWRAWRGGRINGYVSWIDSEITDDWITKWNYDPVSYLNLSFAESLDSENEVLQVNLRGNEMAVSPPWKVHLTVDHAFAFEQRKMTIVPWVTAHWEDESYLTIFNVDKHTDDMNFVISDEDIRFTDDKRLAWSMVHAGVRLYSGNTMAEIYGYNLTDEVVQWWGGAAEQVAKATPVGHWGGEMEIAKAVIFLCETDFVTGETIRVDGGRHLE